MPVAPAPASTKAGPIRLRARPGSSARADLPPTKLTSMGSSRPPSPCHANAPGHTLAGARGMHSPIQSIAGSLGACICTRRDRRTPLVHNRVGCIVSLTAFTAAARFRARCRLHAACCAADSSTLSSTLSSSPTGPTSPRSDTPSVSALLLPLASGLGRQRLSRARRARERRASSNAASTAPSFGGLS